MQDSDLDEKSGLDCSQDAEIIDPRCPVIADPSKDQEPKIDLNCTDDLLKLDPSCLTNSQSIVNQAQDSHVDEDGGAVVETENQEKTLPVENSDKDLVEDVTLPVEVNKDQFDGSNSHKDLVEDVTTPVEGLHKDPDCDQGSIRSLNPECFSSSNFPLVIEDPFQSQEPEHGSSDLILDSFQSQEPEDDNLDLILDSFRSQEPVVGNLCSGLPNFNCLTDPKSISTQDPDSEAFLELESLLSMNELSQTDANNADVLDEKSADKPEVLIHFEPDIEDVKLATQDMMSQIGMKMDVKSTLDQKSAENLNSSVDSNIQVSAGSQTVNSAVNVTEVISNVGISPIQVEPLNSTQEFKLMTSQESQNLETNNIDEEPSFEVTSKINSSLEENEQKCLQHAAFGVEIEARCINQTKDFSDLKEWLLETTTDRVDSLTEIEDLVTENSTELENLVTEDETNENDLAPSEDSTQVSTNG